MIICILIFIEEHTVYCLGLWIIYLAYQASAEFVWF